MKITEITLQGGGLRTYQAPAIEHFTVELEAGFAQSLGGANEAGHPFEEKDENSYDL
ncbi:MAG: hypothetical protein J6K28_01975 [Alistipes sp.]|nr:hypothetical protein [Alistipes sp.]